MNEPRRDRVKVHVDGDHIIVYQNGEESFWCGPELETFSPKLRMAIRLQSADQAAEVVEQIRERHITSRFRKLSREELEGVNAG